MDENNYVVLDSSSIFWDIKPFFIEGEEDGSLVQLQWGWTAGFTKKELEEVADDAPTGHDSVTILFEQAVELRDKLTELIEANKDKVKPRREFNFDPEMEKRLKEAFPLEGD